MIGIENVEVFGWEAAIRGMRNPMNSWEKSDSGTLYGRFVVGKNDYELMQKLVNAGNDHSKFMRMINVTCDITAPLYWWKEYDTYKVGTVANSCSTMHKIHDKEFELSDFSCEKLISIAQDIFESVTVTGFDERVCCAPLNILEDWIIPSLNMCRAQYIETKDKNYWWQMIQLLPTSYNQKRTVQLNYAVLRNMYHSRKNHKLDEWRYFCEWIEGLPYSYLITMKTGGVE